MIEKASGEILKGAASKLSPHYYLRGNKESGPERYLIIYKYEYLRLAEGGQCHGDRDQRNQKKRTGISSVQFSGDGCSEWGDGDNGDFWLLSPLEAPKWFQDPGNGLKSIRGSWGDHTNTLKVVIDQLGPSISSAVEAALGSSTKSQHDQVFR